MAKKIEIMDLKNIGGVPFKQFVKSPFTAILFLCIMALGYSQIANRQILEGQIKDLKDDVQRWRDEAKANQDKLIDFLQNANND
tara:strand:+ start:1610 stop:1861 length:252 start_codon:yes stop_codon:yes gene_type:complete